MERVETGTEQHVPRCLIDPNGVLDLLSHGRYLARERTEILCY